MQGTYDSYPLQSRGIVSINNPDSVFVTFVFNSDIVLI